MKEPVLVVMAAGMGSRYGGLKQIDPVDHEGHIIMDFSIYDAVRAGFKKVIFIIKKENEQDFRDAIGDRLSDKVEIVTKSYKEGAQAVKWTGEGDTEYTLENTEKAERGTDIIMKDYKYEVIL